MNVAGHVDSDVDRAVDTLMGTWVHALPDALIVTDESGIIRFTNDTTLDLFGYPPGELVGMTIETLLPEPMREQNVEHRNACMRARERRPMNDERVLSGRRKDGSHIPLEVGLGVLGPSTGRPATLVLSVVRDASRRLQMEQTVRDAARLLQSVMDALSAHIAVLDGDGIIIAANQAWARFRGPIGPPSTGVGSDYLRACDDAAAGGVVEAADMASTIREFAAGRSAEFTFEDPCRCGDEERWFVGRMTRFEPTEPLRIVVSYEDVTERRRADAERLMRIEIEAERNHLRDAIAAHEQILGVVGHELRTPLAGIRAIAELLSSDPFLDGIDAPQMLGLIRSEAVRMAETVNDLLEASRQKSGHARWNWSRVAVADACRTAAETVEWLIDPSQVVLRVAVDPDLTMLGDIGGIRRLVLNLLSNASKHTQVGRLEVTANALVVDGAEWIEIVVADTGSGMTAETAARLGQAFTLNSGVIGSTTLQGTGLGLSICAGIVAAHGGSIAVDTAVGSGTTVTVRLRRDLPGPALTAAGKPSIANVKS